MIYIFGAVIWFAGLVTGVILDAAFVRHRDKKLVAEMRLVERRNFDTVAKERDDARFERDTAQAERFKTQKELEELLSRL